MKTSINLLRDSIAVLRGAHSSPIYEICLGHCASVRLALEPFVTISGGFQMLAIIGGRGLTQLANLKITHQQVMRTPYGEPSGAFLFGTLNQHEVIFLARHGYGHTIPPHLVNYRANLWALREHGASKIISVATVGGIRADLKPGVIVVPDQIIDYTHGRDATYFRGARQAVQQYRFHLSL